MAFIDIVALVFIGVYGLMGFKKGFIKSIFGLVSVVLAVLLASLIGGEIAKLIGNIPSGNSTLNGVIGNSFYEGMVAKGEIFTTVPPMGYTPELITAALAVLGIPTIFSSIITPPLVDALAGAEGLPLADALSPILANFVLTAISFVLIFIIVWALLLVLSKIINKMFESFTLLKNLDHVLGLVVGIIKGCVVLCIPIMVLGSLNFIPGFSDLVNNSVIVKWFSDNNFITALFASGFDIEGTIKGIIDAIPR